MELPDVGDFCLVVIQKWMNHIMYVVPQCPLCFWYDIQSFAYEFIFMLWIKKNGMHATSKMTYKLVFIIRFTCYTLKCFVCYCYALKHSYTFDMFLNASCAIWYMPKCFFCQLNAPISFLLLLCLMPIFEWGNPLWFFLYLMRWFQINVCISAFVI